MSLAILLWEITPRCEEALDRYEGWPKFYRKEDVLVEYKGRLVYVMAYIMNEGYQLGLPSERYFDSIADGYLAAGLDPNALYEAVKFTETAKNNEG